MGIWDIDWARIQSCLYIKSMLFVRYIFDLRVHCYPVKKGWFWNSNGWTYDPERKDDRNDETCIKEEICKSLNSVMDFLGFIAESESEFEDNMLNQISLSTMDPSDKRFLPLYRWNNFNRAEKVLLRYIEPCVWFQECKI